MELNGKDYILVVDDEYTMRELLRDFLASQGYEVDCQPNAMGALKVLAEKSNVAAVISHIRISPINGFEFLEQMKRQYPHIPVVLFTGAGSSEERDQAHQAGATYLTKPFALALLGQILRDAIASKKAKT